jgi:RNA polymerase sigma-70 factor (ECF subfamily)
VNQADREKEWTSLMEQSLQGDARAYRRLLELLTAALRRVVRGRARVIGIDGEDIVQEVLLALHLKRATWVNGTPVAPWVSAIARNKLIDAFRRRGQQVQVSLESVAESLRADDEEDAERHYDLRYLLGKLNDRQRKVITAVSLEGYSAQEAAQRLRMTEVSVRVTLHRSLKTLAASFRTVPNED